MRGTLAAVKDWLVDRGYALGWALVCRVPESWARRAFFFGGDIAWRRQGRGVQRLEANLRRIVGPQASGKELRALSRGIAPPILADGGLRRIGRRPARSRSDL